MKLSIHTIGERQQSILKSLLLSEAGMTVDELSSEFALSRNAVIQHLATLESMRFVQSTVQPSTGGRPSKLYGLTSTGEELFPRNYDLLASMLIQLLSNKAGDQVVSNYMKELGCMIAKKYQSQLNESKTLEGKSVKLVEIMTELGYEARIGANADGMLEIIADNCVFHQLAAKHKAVCDLDTSLISSALNGASVNHQECMVRNGACCRFLVTL